MKKLDVGEADTLYAIYTKDYGKIRALAQGIRKEEAKLRGHLELWSLSQIRFVIGKGGEKLIAAGMMEYWPRLRSDETRLRLAAVAASEIDAQSFPGERDEGVWQLLRDAFALLDRAESFSESDAMAFLADFRRNLRERLGYGISDTAGTVPGEIP